MSGPYCESCKFLEHVASSDPEFGECSDPSKIIHDRNGNRVNDPPAVHFRYTCSNHAAKPEAAKF